MNKDESITDAIQYIDQIRSEMAPNYYMEAFHELPNGWELWINAEEDWRISFGAIHDELDETCWAGENWYMNEPVSKVKEILNRLYDYADGYLVEYDNCLK